MQPKVSIIIPTYNRLHYLRRTLPTILEQSFADVEFVICDDASIDGTGDWIQSLSDARIRYFRNRHNAGIYGNYQLGLARSRGEYIATYHDHDLYSPEIIEKSCQVLDEFPVASFVHTGLLWIDSSGNVTGVDMRNFPRLMKGEDFARAISRMSASPVMAATAMVRKSALAAVAPYQPLKYGLGCDLMMWFNLSMIGDVGYLNEPLALIRARERNQGTAVFSWKETELHAAMLRATRNAALRGKPLQLLWQRMLLHARIEREWAALMARAALLDRQNWEEGVRFAVRQKAVFPLLVHLVLRFVPGALRFAEKELLKRHYGNVERYLEKEKSKAIDYLKRFPSVRSWANLRTSDSSSPVI